MFDAQLLIAKGTGGSAYSVYSPWMARGGDILRATAEVAHIVGSSTKLTVRVFTKTTETVGDGMDADTDTKIELTTATSTRLTAEWKKNSSSSSAQGLLELVRYKFTIEGTAGDWVLFRMLTPSWFDAVDAS